VHDYSVDFFQDHGGGMYSWVGRHATLGNNFRAIVTTGPGGSFGVISTPDGDYRLIPGVGHDWMVDMTAEQEFLPRTRAMGNDMFFPPADAKALLQQETGTPHVIDAIPGVTVIGGPKATPTPQNVVDMMIVYTPGLAQHLGANLLTRLNFLVTRANTAYVDSEVALTMRLVNATMIASGAYDNTNDSAARTSSPSCATAAASAAPASRGWVPSRRTRFACIPR